MKTKDAIRATMDLSTMVLNSYVSDLEAHELLTRPGRGCNHIAWQLGHLIASEVDLLSKICPDHTPAELPSGFAEAHSKATAGSDEPSGFLGREQYLSLFDRVRATTLAALDNLSEADLDAPAPTHLQSFCPTVGHVFVLIATHPMMHAGQVVPVRRSLGKPVLF
jgi:DinB superfamily